MCFGVSVGLSFHLVQAQVAGSMSKSYKLDLKRCSRVFGTGNRLMQPSALKLWTLPEKLLPLTRGPKTFFRPTLCQKSRGSCCASQTVMENQISCKSFQPALSEVGLRSNVPDRVS